MTSFRIRPRIKKETLLSAEAVANSISEALEQEDTDIIGVVSKYHIALKLPEEDQHYWSPQLSISFRKQGGKTIISGLYGPRPDVWMKFVFGYAFLGLLSFFLVIMGFSQYLVSNDSSLLWPIPLVLTVIIVMYLSAQMGQKKGAEQTYRLHFFIEKVLHEHIVID